LILSCIDIGSNTTRLLVAEAAGGTLRELASQRVFTRIGRSLGESGRIPAEKTEETAAVVAAQVRLARGAGAEEVVAVATAAIREAVNRDDLVAAVEARSEVALRILTGAEEARLSFLGATRTLAHPAKGSVAVVDVGGGSTEIAIGSADGAVAWSDSFRVGSGLLADAHLRSDPPTATELDAVRAHVARVFEDLGPPPAGSAVAVGGTATSLRRLVGDELSHETLERGVRTLSAAPISELAGRFELAPERVRLLPAGILVLAGLSKRLHLPLRIACGGLREGMILELEALSPPRPAPATRSDGAGP